MLARVNRPKDAAYRAIFVEVRQGMTGYSVEVDTMQVFWTTSGDEAEKLARKLVEALSQG